MAGRGTDIKLGGDAESFAAKVAVKGTPEYDEVHKAYLKECEEDKKKVIAAGGLFILGTERHESRRIDNQLRGRAGRQGDPGTSEFYLSLDDDLMRLFGGDKLKAMMKMLKIDEDEEIRHKQISKSVENAQKRIESRNFSSRKSLIEYDDVNNTQREVVYEQRDAILKNENLKELNNIIHPQIRKNISEQIQVHKNEKLVFVDVPLLFEAKFDDLVEKIIVISLDEKIQLERLMNRNSLSKEEALQRIKSQIPVREKEKLGDYVVDNSFTQENTYNQVDRILEKLKLGE